MQPFALKSSPQLQLGSKEPHLIFFLTMHLIEIFCSKHLGFHLLIWSPLLLSWQVLYKSYTTFKKKQLPYFYLEFGVFVYNCHPVADLQTSLSNGYPVIVIRGLSDLAGAQEGQNSISLYGTLAASNVAQVVVQFIKLLPRKLHSWA